MKKVVVVNKAKSIFFEGEALTVINKPSEIDSSQTYVGPELLIVKDKDKTIGVFRKWDYWKKLD